MVEWIRDAIDWNQKDLAVAASISEGHLSTFLNAPDVEIGRHNICRIAWALAGGVDGVKRVPADDPGDDTALIPATATRAGRDSADLFVNGLLRLGGYEPATRFENVTWHQKFERPGGLAGAEATPENRATVAWFPWGPVVPQGPQFTGLVHDVSVAVARLLGTTDPEFVPVTFGNLEQQLRERTVDMVAPIMVKVPRRLSWYRFSDDVPGLSARFDLLIERDKLATIIEREGLDAYNNGGRARFDQLRLHRIRACVASSESSGLIADVLLSNSIDVKRVDVGPLHAADTIDRLLQFSETADDRVNTAFTHAVVCENEVRSRTDVVRLGNVVDWPELQRAALPFGFGVHPDEPALLDAINQSIRTLHVLGFFEQLRDRYTKANPVLTVLFDDDRAPTTTRRI